MSPRSAKSLRRIRRLHAAPADADLLTRVYANRGITDPSELDHGLRHLLPPSLLGGLKQAAILLEAALRGDWPILVVGDFDTDGATSTALALRALRAMGATRVDYLVPNRFVDGHGLSPSIVERALAGFFASTQGSGGQSGTLPRGLLLTVDNGISSHEGVRAAREAGLRVLITDHHLPGDVLPDADALVNPNLVGETFPSKSLAGVGVIFYVLAGLRAHLREQSWFAARGLAEPNMAAWLDLVALGTVADVAPLDRNNRILVEQGMARIRAGQTVPGIRALLSLAGRDPGRLVAADLGFAVAPRLNAAGRLDDMGIGIRCLLADEDAEAMRLARMLDGLNQERRELEQQMREQARSALERLLQAQDRPVHGHGVCLYDPDWHQGLLGILAGRIREQIHRPVVVFADGGDGRLKGSARSIPGLHIRDVLERVAALHPDLIERFGGHAMAAGLTLSQGDLPRFSQAFEQVVQQFSGSIDSADEILSDGPLAEHELCLPVAESLRSGGPWGAGFPEPVFDGGFEVLERRLLSEGRHLRLRLRPLDARVEVTAMAFNIDPESWPIEHERLHLAYRLDVNEYRGNRSLQLLIEHALVPDGPQGNVHLS